ncbi:MAG: ferritin-like domain-containing protein [Bdellovibrionota bacterium]
MAASIPQSPDFSPYDYENFISFDNWPKLANSVEGSKRQFWNDDTMFEEIYAKHGGIKATEDQKKAIAGLMSIIYYGEIVAMHTAAQLVGMVSDTAAQHVLSFQAMEESKHVTAMGKYLKALGVKLPEINPYAKKLLDDLRNTTDPVAKLLGMNLIVENVAHSLFQTLMENFEEPVLQELLHYIDLDEVKHVALARNYLPSLLKDVGPVRRARVLAMQVYWNYLMFKAQDQIMRETKVLMIDWNAQMKRDFRDWRKMYKDLPKEAQRLALFKPPSKEWAEKIADWVMPPEKYGKEALKQKAAERAAKEQAATA